MSTRVCSVVGCDMRGTRRGWCGKHYARWRKHGDPLGSVPPRFPRLLDPQWLELQYRARRRTTTDIAEQLGCSPVAVSVRLRQFKIPTRRDVTHPSHGHTRGGDPSGAYRSWVAMRARCRNPNAESYERYGGAGVTVCDRWERFENFLADMGERPEGRSVDRIDSNGNYEPSNCRWATAQEQSQNRRPYRHRKERTP